MSHAHSRGQAEVATPSVPSLRVLTSLALLFDTIPMAIRWWIILITRLGWGLNHVGTEEGGEVLDRGCGWEEVHISAIWVARIVLLGRRGL